MEFDKSRVYTALNADELKPGSKVIFADDLAHLKYAVTTNTGITTLVGIQDEEATYRFQADKYDFMLAYLVEEPQFLKWTDLKIGDIIEYNITHLQYMITGIDRSEYCVHHLHYAGGWQDDEYLYNYHKVVTNEKTQK